jgi:hypothetical protein
MAAVVGSEDDGTLRLAMVAAGMLVALSTIVLHPSYRLPAGGHMPVLTATYFTVETISTVGFGDVSFSGQSTSLEVFGIVPHRRGCRPPRHRVRPRHQCVGCRGASSSHSAASSWWDWRDRWW